MTHATSRTPHPYTVRVFAAVVVRFAVGLGTALGVFASTGQARAQGMPPTLVETGVVSTRTFHDQLTLIGRTAANAQSRVVSEVTGRVLRVDALEGAPVRRGDVLVTIDSARLRLQLEAKRAQVAQARSAAELARKNLERTANLHGRNLSSDGQFDADTAAQQRADAYYNQLLAEEKTLQLDLKRCAVRTPFAGYTVRKLVDVGEGVVPGTPVYEVVDLSRVKVTVDLPERYFGHVATGSSVRIERSEEGVRGSASARLTGMITGIAPAASSETHTFPVMITVENTGIRLGAGMLVRTIVPLDRTFTGFAVHKDAIVRQGLQTMVYTIADGKAAPVPVRIRAMAGDTVAISGDAIHAGMTVVVRGNERIFPGSPVRVAGGQPGAKSGRPATHPGKNSGGAKEAAGDASDKTAGTHGGGR